MTDQYLDYSLARPSPAKIKSLDCVGVMRYLSDPNITDQFSRAKDIKPGEARELLDAGLSIGLVWETTAHRAGEGQGAGAEDRRDAEAQADKLGVPDDVVIFMAVDYDAKVSAVLPYFKGCQPNAKRPIGVYGGVDIVAGVVGQLGVQYGWQTYAWSEGKTTPKAHLYQYRNGSDWDFNRVLHPFPVWTHTTTPPVTPPTGVRNPVDNGRTVKVIPPDGKITTPYGTKATNPRTHKSYWVAGYHPGDDWNLVGSDDNGKPCLSPVEGVVVGAGMNVWPVTAYGRQVVVRDILGEHTAVCHLSALSVAKGEKVYAGQQLGKVGASGNAYGSHVHVERRHAAFGYWQHEKPLYDYPRPAERVIVLEELVEGSFSDSVYWLQRAINDVSLTGGKNLRLTGRFDAKLVDEVKKFQVQKAGNGGDGLLGPKQLAMLLELSGLQGVSVE